MLALGLTNISLELYKSKSKHIKAVIEMHEHPDCKSSLVVGYHYDLLHKYASDLTHSIDVSVCPKGLSYLDSLKAGVIDLLAVPYSDSLSIDSVLFCTPIDSGSVWLLNYSDQRTQRRLNSWIAEQQSSEDFSSRRDLFMRRFDIHRSRPRARLSPYDDIIRSCADSLGVDWHMIASVIYKESRFHIEARSSRGARGLMQMMPQTAALYGVADYLDPGVNIGAGSSHLYDLSRRYKRIAANSDECFKYTLAAYNAGIGRLEDILGLAEANGLNAAYWDSVVVVIPQMSAELLDTSIVKCGPFKGTETLAYVDEVLSIYEDMKRVCQ